MSYPTFKMIEYSGQIIVYSLDN